MSKVYYKAVCPDGTDFYSGTIDYAAAVGGRVKAPGAAHKNGYRCCTADVLHAGLTPTDVWAGTSWPLRLFEVAGRPMARADRKVGFRSLAVLREIPAHLAFGPQGEHVAALIDRARALTADEASRLVAARDAARDAALVAVLVAARGAVEAAAWDAARDAARDAALVAARGAALVAVLVAARGAARDAVEAAGWDAAWDAASALAVRDLVGDLFTQAHYDLLTQPWREVIGPVHPEDGA